MFNLSTFDFKSSLGYFDSGTRHLVGNATILWLGHYLRHSCFSLTRPIRVDAARQEIFSWSNPLACGRANGVPRQLPCIRYTYTAVDRSIIQSKKSPILNSRVEFITSVVHWLPIFVVYLFCFVFTFLNLFNRIQQTPQNLFLKSVWGPN